MVHFLKIGIYHMNLNLEVCNNLIEIKGCAIREWNQLVLDYLDRA